MARRNTLVLIFPSGQLGNQLFGLACALHLSEVYSDRVYVAIKDKELSIRFELNEIDEDLRNHGIVVVSASSLINCISFAFKVLDYFKGKKVELVLSPLYKKFRTLREPWNSVDFGKDRYKRKVIVRGYFQDVKMIQQLSQSSREIIKKIIGFDKDSLSNDSVHIIGVHMRRGDYEKIGDYGTLSLEYFLSALGKFTVRETTVVASSDSEEALDLLANKKKIIKLGPSQFSPLKTMRTLTSCNYFIMSNSTFSFWIGWFVAENGGIVIAPEPWFKEAKVPNGYLYLDSFKRLESRFDK